VQNIAIFGMRDENPSPTLGGELVRRPGEGAEGAKPWAANLSLRGQAFNGKLLKVSRLWRNHGGSS
jgi:hypothetical protein